MFTTGAAGISQKFHAFQAEILFTKYSQNNCYIVRKDKDKFVEMHKFY